MAVFDMYIRNVILRGVFETDIRIGLFYIIKLEQKVNLIFNDLLCSIMTEYVNAPRAFKPGDTVRLTYGNNQCIGTVTSEGVVDVPLPTLDSDIQIRKFELNTDSYDSAAVKLYDNGVIYIPKEFDVSAGDQVRITFLLPDGFKNESCVTEVESSRRATIPVELAKELSDCFDDTVPILCTPFTF